MAVLEPVVVRFKPVRIAGQSAQLPERSKRTGPAGEHLVRIGLVSCVPDDHVARGDEDAVEGERQFDDSEIRAKVAAVLRHGLDDHGTDLGREFPELVRRESPEVSWIRDARENRRVMSLTDQAHRSSPTSPRARPAARPPNRPTAPPPHSSGAGRPSRRRIRSCEGYAT